MDDMWDPSSLFPYEQQLQQQTQEEEEIKDHQHQHQHQHQQVLVQQDQEEKEEFLGQRNGNEEEEDDDQNKPSEDLSMMFLEWLKSNKESISVEDLRSIKLKRSTIECATKRLGGGKEGMKHLVKLILEWVQNHHLQKKRDQTSSPFPPHQQNPHQNSNPSPNFMTNTSPPSWVSSLPPYDHSLMYLPPPSPSMLSYMHGDHDFSLFASPPTTHVNPYSSSSSTTSSHSPNLPSTPPHFPISSPPPQYIHQDSHLVPPPQPVPTLQRSFSNNPCPQMFQGSGGEGSLMRVSSSASKEARKKRMARQRNHHRSSSKSSTHHHQNQQTRLVVDNSCTTTTTTTPPPLQQQQTRPSSPSPTSVASSSKRFLLQKVLKQSDVGNLGRIVLPKKEA